MRAKLLSFGLLAVLAACGGGGGGGGGTPTPPVEPPSLSVVSMSPASSSTGVNPDGGTLSVTLRAHGYTNPRSGYTLTCGQDRIFPLTEANPDQWNATTEQLVVSAPYTDLPNNASCEMSSTLMVDTPAGGTPNSLGWSLKFTTAQQPLHYGSTVVGVLGGRMFAMTITKPYVVRRDSSPPSGLSGRPTPAPYLVGTALTPTGRVPTGYAASSASGPYVILVRFNPVTAKSSQLLLADPFPADHTVASLNPGPGWRDGVGGVGAAPTATAKFWTSDGSGGWFYVETADLETLLHRDAAGAVETVFREAGLSFSTMHTLSN